MPLVPMRDLLAAALSGGYAVGYFEAWDQYSLEAVLEAAEECRSPVILGFGGAMMDQVWFSDGGLRRLAALGRVTAENARVPVSYLLNEVETLDHIAEGLACGFNAVMLDASELPLDENIEATRRVVQAAHAVGADVEGECDPLPDASGMMGQRTSKLTAPDEAARYVLATGVDALSVSIGNEHIRTQGESSPDLDLLPRLRDAVRVPLVIHGGTGFPEWAVPQAIERGVAKFNVGTVLKRLFFEAVRQSMHPLPKDPNFQEIVGSRKPRDFLQQAKLRVKNEVMRRIALYGSPGRA